MFNNGTGEKKKEVLYRQNSHPDKSTKKSYQSRGYIRDVSTHSFLQREIRKVVGKIKTEGGFKS